MSTWCSMTYPLCQMLLSSLRLHTADRPMWRLESSSQQFASACIWGTAGSSCGRGKHCHRAITQPGAQPQLCELGFSNDPNGWMAFSMVAGETLKQTVQFTVVEWLIKPWLWGHLSSHLFSSKTKKLFTLHESLDATNHWRTSVASPFKNALFYKLNSTY